MTVLFVAWRSGGDDGGVWGPVGRLDYDGRLYRFCYTRGAINVKGFRPFPGMGDLNQVYESDTLFPLFANRLLSRSRPEYEEFLCWGGFDPDNPPDPVAVLGVTGGERATDSIEVFPCAAPDAEGCYLSKFFLHGIRWMPRVALERIERLKEEERLFPMPDPCNQHDDNAVAIRTDSERTLIGYVPRYLAQDIRQLLWECDPSAIKLVVARLNRQAPLQQRVLCRMRACWPDGFQPCSDEVFSPIPANVPANSKAH